MANLREFLYGYQEGTAILPREFSVFNVDTTTAANGGQCCLWTVPAGVTYAVFEMWSGGGGGAYGCCCMQGGGAGSGGYAIKACTVAAGQQIRICAAGSTDCDTGNCSGICGCCTFVCSLGGGGQSTWLSNLCGARGVTSTVSCQFFGGCYGCCTMCFCCGGIGNNVDFNVPGTTGSSQPTQYCVGDGIQFSANAPHTAPGPRPGPGGCRGWGGSSAFGLFPGGGGHTAQVYGGNCCWGGPGAGGLVYVVFY